MTVRIKRWSDTVVPCEVKLTQQCTMGDSAIEANFSIVHDGREIAQGWCLVPAGTRLGTRITDVRITAEPNTWSDVILCVSDFKIDDAWLSDVVNSQDPLHPHDRPRAVRSY